MPLASLFFRRAETCKARTCLRAIQESATSRRIWSPTIDNANIASRYHVDEGTVNSCFPHRTRRGATVVRGTFVGLRTSNKPWALSPPLLFHHTYHLSLLRSTQPLCLMSAHNISCMTCVAPISTKRGRQTLRPKAGNTTGRRSLSFLVFDPISVV